MFTFTTSTTAKKEKTEMSFFHYIDACILHTKLKPYAQKNTHHESRQYFSRTSSHTVIVVVVNR